jgi:hypothetical protein
MGMVDFVDYVQSLTPFTVYPLAFPEDAENEAVMIKFEPSFSNSGGNGVMKANLQIIVRSLHPAIAEEKANDILKHFDERTNFFVGPFHVVLANSRNPFPMFMNEDSLHRYRYNLNINLLMSK